MPPRCRPRCRPSRLTLCARPPPRLTLGPPPPLPLPQAVLSAYYKLTKAAAFDSLALTPELIKAVLEYHVVPGAAATAADLTNGQLLPTLDTEAPPLEVRPRGPEAGGRVLVATEHNRVRRRPADALPRALHAPS